MREVLNSLFRSYLYRGVQPHLFMVQDPWILCDEITFTFGLGLFHLMTLAVGSLSLSDRVHLFSPNVPCLFAWLLLCVKVDTLLNNSPFLPKHLRSYFLAFLWRMVKPTLLSVPFLQKSSFWLTSNCHHPHWNSRGTSYSCGKDVYG